MEMEHVEVCRGRQQPKRVRWLVLLCLFAGVTLLVLLWQSPVVHAALPKGWVPTEALDAPFIDQREKYPTGCAGRWSRRGRKMNTGHAVPCPDAKGVCGALDFLL